MLGAVVSWMDVCTAVCSGVSPPLKDSCSLPLSADVGSERESVRSMTFERCIDRGGGMDKDRDLEVARALGRTGIGGEDLGFEEGGEL